MMYRHLAITFVFVACTGMTAAGVEPSREPVAAAASAAADPTASSLAVAQLKKHLKLAATARPSIAGQEFATVALTRDDAAEAERLLWADHVQRIKQTRFDEMKARRITSGNLQMPFYYAVFGNKPKSGRSLYISLHGGGGAPPQVNDRQWENQKRLYQVKEGVYLVPRAPTNTWNLWHQGHIDGMFDRLIENLIVFENVNPNRVYILGYSAGGDGVYQLAPRMADRLAGAAMMAGHPNEASPLGLRNVAFTIQVGANDSGYNRNKVAREWGKKLDALQKEDPNGYVHWTKIYEGKGHWLDRQDAAALPWMARYDRNPLPTRIVWRQDDVTHARFYWLAVKPQEQRKGVEIRAALQGQRFEVQAGGIGQLIVRMNDRMLNLDENVIITSNAKQLFAGRVHRSIGTLAQTLAERGDPASVFSAQVVVTLPK